MATVEPIEFDLTGDDLIAFNKFMLWGGGRLRPHVLRVPLVVILIAVILIAAFPIVVQAKPDTVLRSILPLVVIIAIILFAFRQPTNSVTWDGMPLKRSNPLWQSVAHMTVSLTAEGIAVKLVQKQPPIESQGVNLWSGIRAIKQTDTHFFLTQSNTTAIIVPRRAFGSQAQEQQFISTVQNYLEAARPA